MLASMLAGSAALQGPLLPARAAQQPQLSAANFARAGTPKLSTWEEYQAKLGNTPQAADSIAGPPEAVPSPIPAAVENPRAETINAAVSELTRDNAYTVVPSSARPARRNVVPPEMPKVIHEASDLLSHQAIMENFVHHNPWESLQAMEFFEALDSVEEKMTYMSPGERLSSLAPLDPRIRANKAMAELGAPFLDRGLAKWEAPHRDKGFLYFFANLEDLGFAAWRDYARDAAQEILTRFERNPGLDVEELAATILEEELRVLEPDMSLWTQTTRSMMLDLPGWAGMFKRMEESPKEAPETCDQLSCLKVPVHLSEFVAVHAIMARSSIEDQAIKVGWDPSAQMLSEFLAMRATNTKRRGERPIFGMGKEMESLQNPSGLATRNQNFLSVKALEAKYEGVTLRAISRISTPLAGTNEKSRPSIQFYTCFDEREESFRRYIEAAAVSANEIETFGCAGFFNMAIRYKPDNKRPEEILAPEGNIPPSNHRVAEKQLTPGYNERKKLQAELSLAFEKATYSPVGSLAISGALLPYSMGRLLTRSFSPEQTVKIEDAISGLANAPVTDFEMPYTTEEATERLAQLYKNIGTKDNFARIIIVTGHGSRSINNPFLAAYNCGACCGREGGPNARIFARCANDPKVRAMLKRDHDIAIPNDTWFVGGYHE